ncbi:MAG: glutamate synthase subunit alpha, partial [Treponema sp.]|nr:glutamate synthase subunit alpha [Treponema sp.]
MGEREGGAGQGPRGLYRRENERDSCGIGFVADIRGRRSHGILKRGLEVLERMEHRGAESADNKTGDGSGVLMQIPHAFYKKLIPGLPDPGFYGTGLFFAPRPGKGDFFPLIKKHVEDAALYMGLKVLAWRDVPTDNRDIGLIAASAEPAVKQLVLVPERGENAAAGKLGIETRLAVFRTRLEKALLRDETLDRAGAKTYFASLSSRTIVYKGMLMPKQLKDYYPELKDESLETAVAQIHSRFSTNTFPDWPLAQPFRLVSHNGEINTIKGNRFWMAAREALFTHSELGPFLADICPVIEPGRSDSASFDNALELLVMAGRSLPQALMMLIPESWNDRNPIPGELKAFYEYSACMMEPWDGPASMVFCDGRYVGGTLDRNGLRPSRYTITRDQLIVMGSETGVQDFRPEEVEFKGRLLPGKLLLVDLEEGRIIPDDEVKREVVRMRPYGEWVSKNVVTLDQEHGEGGDGDGAAGVLPVPSATPLAMTSALPAREALFMERAAGYTREDREKLLLPMAEYGQEPTSSMGTDTPLAVFSEKSQRVYAYFKQLFAQVTNPPIDSIREDLVMTLTSFAGPQLNLLEETGDHCRRIKVVSPILTEKELDRLKAVPGFKNRALDASFLAGGERLEAALDRLVSEAARAVGGGASLVVLSDRAALPPEAGRCAVPALLAVGAVHHGLIGAGLRMKASIIVETSEPREIMHYALLFGYGADLVVPYGAFNAIALICGGYDGKRLRSYAEAEAQYVKGIQKAMLKVISKMGTSTLRSYRGAQIFDAVGLGDGVIEMCFRGTVSRIGGAGFAELEAEAVSRYREALAAWEKSPNGPDLPNSLLVDDGQYRWRKYGEKHAWNPETIYLLQWAAHTGDYAKFKQFTALADGLNQSPHVIRGLLDFAAPGSVKGGPLGPVPLEEVEPAEAIMRRFTTGAMSLGSLSKEAHETIARTMNAIGSRSNS